LITVPREKFTEPPVLSPKESVRSRAKQLNLSLRLPNFVLLSLSVGATVLLVDAVDGKAVPWIYKARPLYIGRIGRTRVGVIWAAPGAALTAVVMEDMIASEVTSFIGVGTLGAIQSFIGTGDLIVPSLAVRDEGTSHHYLPKENVARPSRKTFKNIVDSCEKSGLKQYGLKHYVGPIWTTDAPYRETRSKIRHFKREGVLGVDMETSVIFSLGMYRRVETGCILVAGENLNRSNPPGPFYRDELTESLSHAVDLAVESASNSQTITLRRT
jgi:uridine phosphorylase